MAKNKKDQGDFGRFARQMADDGIAVQNAATLLSPTVEDVSPPGEDLGEVSAPGGKDLPESSVTIVTNPEVLTSNEKLSREQVDDILNKKFEGRHVGPVPGELVTDRRPTMPELDAYLSARRSAMDVTKSVPSQARELPPVTCPENCDPLIAEVYRELRSLVRGGIVGFVGETYLQPILAKLEKKLRGES